METIVNKVAGSGLVQLDLEEFLPHEPVVVFDLKDHLFMQMILKEKDFREAMKNMDWKLYEGKVVAVTCSVDAVIPMWAYMLVAAELEPVAGKVYMGNEREAAEKFLLEKIAAMDVRGFENGRVVVKGCGEREIGPAAYAEITRRLRPVVRSIMYGEPCSTVPVFKKK
ncbi:MAG: DUF2480 family protein [Chitinophagaceae bacterium]|nr:MAG: DUF2480 family protein [Chitinophagaceae bacterium]